MDLASFRQAMLYAFSDIRREIALAKVSEKEEGKKALQALGIQPGGGNFLAALGLLCYTETAGKEKYGHGTASGNFNGFFDSIGPEYKAFRGSHNVYDIFRCGLAHEYFVKKNCVIGIEAPEGQPLGIGVLPTGQYYFAVEPYCDDLERAYAGLETHLAAGGGAGKPANVTTSGYIAGS